MLQSKKQTLTGRQKAAIFLITLGPEVASEVFKHLRDDEVETLTFEMARLDKVTPEDKEQVLIEFNELMMAQDFITSGGIDYAREVLERALGTQKAIDIINRLTSSLQVRPFDFIRRTDPQHLLNFIQNEHPHPPPLQPPDHLQGLEERSPEPTRRQEAEEDAGTDAAPQAAEAPRAEVISREFPLLPYRPAFLPSQLATTCRLPATTRSRPPGNLLP